MGIEIDDDVFSEFAVEAMERLNSIEEMLLDMEVSSNQDEDIKQVFRDIHTIKGNSQFLGIENIMTLSHAFEDMFGALRTETIPLTKELIDASLEGVDYIRSWINEKDLTSQAPIHLYTLMKDITAGKSSVHEPAPPIIQAKPKSSSEDVETTPVSPQVSEKTDEGSETKGGMVRVFSLEPAHVIYFKIYGDFNVKDLGEQLSGALFDFSSADNYAHFIVDVENLSEPDDAQVGYLTRFVHEADIFDAKVFFLHAGTSFKEALDTDVPMLEQAGDILSYTAG